MRVLIDTNQLLYIVNEESPHCNSARQALAALIAGKHSIVVTPQTMTEFWRGATRSLEAQPPGLGMTGDMAAAMIAYFRSKFLFLADRASIFEEWLSLARNHNVTGVHVHDARLVATIVIFQLDFIVTGNVRDFRRFTEIRAVTPEEVLRLVQSPLQSPEI